MPAAGALAAGLMGIGVVPALAGMQVLGPSCGTLLCAGRNGRRVAIDDLPDGAGGWYVVTNDVATDPLDPPDGGFDIGLIHLGPDLLPRPINPGPGGDDPCGALLVGGAGVQEAHDALALEPGRYVVAAQEIPFGDAQQRVFAWGFDGSAAPLYAEPFVSPTPADVKTWAPRLAPDGAGGFYLAYEQYAPPPEIFADIYLARYDRDGRAAWPAPLRLTAATTAFDLESIAADPAGGAWVAWRDRPPGLTLIRPQNFVQHARPDGVLTLPTGGVPLDPARDTDGTPFSALFALPEGVMAATAYMGYVSTHFIGEHGERFWGSEGRLFRTARGGSPRDFRILRAADGSFRLLWVEDHELRWWLATTRFERDGTSPWPAAIYLAVGDLGILGFDVALRADGTLIAAASVDPDVLSDSFDDLRAQAVDARGRIKAPPGGGAVCALAGSYQLAPRILDADDGLVRLLWTDTREGNWPEDGINYFTSAVLFTTRPILPAVAAPIALVQGGTATLTIDGDDLDPAAAIAPGEGIVIVSAEVTPLSSAGPGDRLTLTLRADAGAGVGTRPLVLTNPDGEAATIAGYLRVTLDARRIDIDGSGRTDGFDLVLLARGFGRSRGEAGYTPGADIDGSGTIDGTDLALLASRFGGPPQ